LLTTLGVALLCGCIALGVTTVQAKGTPAEAILATIKAPPGFEFTAYGIPPQVNYPVCLSAAPTGELFVGIDEQGSLGKTPGKGRVVRCIDADDDGVADQFTTFATMDHPRGLIYDQNTLWVLHPPTLTVYHDDNADGVSDRSQALLTGISTKEVQGRGADHTTNGIRLGIDGWIYIAVGDFGFNEARGADGRTLSRRGGGVVRIRPDGSDAEIYAWGLRNILDVAIDPYMNIFTRDNTNDGGGWNVRFSHVIQSGEYGYPSRFINFTEETMPTLADYGGGSGCGSLYLHDLRWPKEYGDAVYTCDWGRSQVYRHVPAAEGATFQAHQEIFLTLPQPTDIDVDGSGRMYVSSWKNGGFNYKGPNVGFVTRITPADFKPTPFPDLTQATDAELVAHHGSPSAVYRQHSQLELVRRGNAPQRADLLEKFASDPQLPLYGRVAAIFTLKQLAGSQSTAALVKLAGDATVREFALRALTDRKGELAEVPTAPFIAALADKNPRVRAQALISLGRLGRADTASAILPLTMRAADAPLPTAKPLHAQPDPARVLPHLAVRALVAIGATPAYVQALDGPHRAGALAVLRQLHNEEAVEGLVQRLSKAHHATARQELLSTLIRLYYREGNYTKGDWWGTRPDTVGPYYDRQKWACSDRIAKIVSTAYRESDPTLRAFLDTDLQRHRVKLAGATGKAAKQPADEPATAIVPPKVDASNPNLIANLPFEQSLERASKTAGNAQQGQSLFKQQSCVACHTVADGQQPKGPHLVDIGNRYKRIELIESILKPSHKIAQGFDTYTFITDEGKIFTGFVVSESAEHVQLRQTDGMPIELRKDAIEARNRQEISMMPVGLVNNLTPEELANLLAYLESIKSGGS
jgi:putative heme-binding domain-containing protein